MVGPMDFTTNDECGLLIEGHERPPIILWPWHHPYYQALYREDEGIEKAMDLLMWSLHMSGRATVRDAIWRRADKLESEHGIVCRKMRKRDLHAEVTRFLEVYNAAWEHNWASVPLTEEEVRHYAKDLKPVLDENWAFLAEEQGHRRGRRRGADAARLQPGARAPNGRLLPFGWVKALY